MVGEILNHQAQGVATNRSRERVVAGPAVHLNSMMAADYQSGVFGFKTYTVASGSCRFFVYLYSADTGDLLCVLEANRLGQRFRTDGELENNRIALMTGTIA